MLGRDTPLEVIVVWQAGSSRDVGGSIGWIEKKSLAECRTLVVRVPLAEVRATPDHGAARLPAELNVLLEPAEAVMLTTTTATPCGIKVRHRDGQTGYVRVVHVRI